MPETAVRLQPDRIAVTLRGKTLPDCTALIPDPLLPLTLGGNEPDWSLTLSPAELRLEGDARAALSEALPVAETEGETLVFRVDWEGRFPRAVSRTMPSVGSSSVACV